uniref:Uncharacterized protein n=1 Tax=Pseudo-nitzschia australis TaxID=44445 RepID=A0A7S4AWS8_9STRA|eukprot:CAMPEP_0168191714 /NCGR_PEP_ID=MMETSP0139_2-20121125/17666_1 /TAXON_ID=44445 /ORGANISM="Pseudo-nitzschia australis, Strain 10249 10 AB" /LENGTH=337 /DNA_ID=CAMNT_0008114913 /DNA_START=98 /DNA_END=1111 /DNA_ORIENTATION=-
MTPSLSKQRYSSCSSPIRSSPVGTKRIICNQESDSLYSSLPPLSGTKTVDCPPLTSSVAVITNFNIVVEEDEDMLAHSDHDEDVSSENDDHSYEYVENCVSRKKEEHGLQEEYAKYGHGETSMAMIIDDEDYEEIKDGIQHEYGDASVPSLTAASFSPNSKHSRKAFCPKRMPQRSSMKGVPSEQFDAFSLGQHNPVQVRRSITFDNRINIQKVEPARLLAADPQSLWFQATEYETIKMKTLALLDRVDQSSGMADGKKYCMRGLEAFMTPERGEVKKHQAWDCVFNEQFLQRQEGELDEESLASIYKYSTKRSQKEASKRGSLDAKMAQAILKTIF